MTAQFADVNVFWLFILLCFLRIRLWIRVQNAARSSSCQPTWFPAEILRWGWWRRTQSLYSFISLYCTDHACWVCGIARVLKYDLHDKHLDLPSNFARLRFELYRLIDKLRVQLWRNTHLALVNTRRDPLIPLTRNHTNCCTFAGDCVWKLACSVPTPPWRTGIRVCCTGEGVFAKNPAANTWSPGECSLLSTMLTLGFNIHL